MTAPLAILAVCGWALALLMWIRANAEQDRADTAVQALRDAFLAGDPNEALAWARIRAAEARVREVARRAEELRRS
jgi:1,6-anhydro-N-acetylmuramate kinase